MSTLILKNESHWNGNHYQDISKPMFQINKAALELIDFSAIHTVLDIGCGSGETTRFIAEKNPKLIVQGVDSNASMISVAEKHKLKNVSFLNLNAENINFIDKFCLVTSFFCMHWIKNKDIVINAIYNSLKENGIFLMSSPMPHAFLPKVREELIKSDRWSPYFKEYSDPLAYINDFQYQNYAKNSGFQIEKNELNLHRVFFESEFYFNKFMTEMTPCLSFLPNEDEKKKFIIQLIKNYKKHCLEEKNHYYLDFNMITLKATKSIQ